MKVEFDIEIRHTPEPDVVKGIDCNCWFTLIDKVTIDSSKPVIDAILGILENHSQVEIK